MKRKISILVIVGCLLILANVSAAENALTITEKSSNEFVKPIQDIDQQLEEDTSTTSFEKYTTPPSVEESFNNVILESRHYMVVPNANQNVQSVANAGGPYAAETGETITFDASNCILILGASYEWDFRDGMIGYGLHPTHSYSSPGVHHVILTVTTLNGDTYQDIAPVYIDQEGDHLQPYGGYFYEGEVDESIVFDGSQSISTDPNAPITQWIWHFGDGTVGYGEKVTHSYNKEKVYLVTLEIRDADGNMRQDVLHADIGRDYTCVEDFFVNTDGIAGDLIDYIFEGGGMAGVLFCQLFFVKIYTKYNDIEKTTTINNFWEFPKSIDVNYDGNTDITIDKPTFFKPVISQSEFNDFAWFAFETTVSDMKLTSDSDITTDDDFTVCLQFSLQIMEDFLELDEPIVRIGYNSPAGEEKPTDFSATHIFRPYLLLKLLNGGNAQPNSQPNQNMNAYPVTGVSTTSMQTTQVTGTTSRLLILGGDGGANPTTTAGRGGVTLSTTQVMSTQQQRAQPNPNPEEGRAIITENGVRVESSDADHFSILISFSNTLGTTKTTFAATFESFITTTLMHRKSLSIRDVDLQGSDDSALTLSITRENQYGSAKLGILINPLQSFGFHVDIGKLSNNARHIAFNIDNPPENLVLFVESEDTQGDQNSLYFYLKNIPTTIDLEWLPRLDYGYISLTKEYASDDLVIGICDDLEDPYTNLYMTNLPTYMSLNWQITSESPKIITFYSDTEGLTLNAELKDVTQQDQTIDFHATSNEDLDIKFLWSLPDGYFELERSTRNIDFDFSLSQKNLLLDITGNYIGGPEDGFVFNFNGLEQGSIEVNSDKELELKINAEALDTTLNTDLEFSTGGNIKLEWDESTNVNVDGTASLGLYNFNLFSPDGSITASEIILAGNSNFGLILEGDSYLQLGGSGQVTLSQFEGEVGYWSGSIDSANAGGGFDIILKPSDKYYKLDTSNSISLDGFDIVYDRPDGQEHDFVFEIDSFSMNSEGTTWFDFSGDTPQFTLDGENDIDLNNLHLSIGSGTLNAIDFTISNAHLDNDGTIYGEWDEDNLFVDATVDFNWDLTIATLNYGNWEAHGNIEGSASMDAEWEDGSGSIEFVIGESGLVHNLEIIHDGLTLNLGSFNFDPGTITFDWQGEDATNNGHFNILNTGVDGNLTLCKISYPPSGFELELGDINVESGNLYMDWARATDQKMIHINNGMTVDMDLIKVTKSGKTIALEGLGLKPGEFKFTWDTTNKEITLNNGIEDLGPSCYYEDADRKLAVDLTNLEHDYSKTMTLKWYETGGSISGLYLDTDGTQLVDWIEFESIKYDSSGDTGRRLALGGFQADNFELKKNVDGNLEVSGKLYIANHLTYSKLVNDDWKDLDVQWNLNLNGVGSIEFDIDFAFDLDALDISSSFLGVDITSNFDWEHPNYQHHIKFSWDVDFDLNGNVFIDTDWEGVDVTFTIKKDTSSYQPKWGVSISTTSMKAENYMIYWDFSNPPGQWVIGNSGTIEPGSLNSVYIAWNGNWYNLLSGGTPV